MKKRKFTEEQRQELKSNPNVKDVTSVAVLYTEAFKKEALELHNKGLTPIEIFIQAGFNIDTIGKENPSKILSKWKNGIGYNPNQSDIQLNPNKIPHINTQKSSYSDKEIKKILARNKYLEAENDFLKKLKALENNFR